MTRLLVALAIIALLTVKVGDTVAHVLDHNHHHEHGEVVVIVEASDDCSGPDSYHTAAHCASHMADSMQRSVATTPFHGVTTASPVLVTGSTMHDGRILSPPVRPPLA